MNFKPKFYYDNGANEGGGSGDTTAGTLPNEGNQQEPPKQEIPSPIITDEELKTYGFDSKDAFKTFLAKHKEDSVPEAERQEKANIEKANLLKFAAENKLLKVEEYNQYETLKSKSDKDLVFENYLSEYKDEHKDITDPSELEAAAKEDFDYEYKLKDGETETAKAKGLKKLEREAKELRNPIETKVTAAQEQFKQNNNIRETYPKFEKLVKETVLKNTPDKTILYKAKDGENEIPVEIELTQKDRDAMAKEFMTPKTFQKFLDLKPEEFNAMIDKKQQGWVKLNKFDEVNAKTFEIGKGIGVKSGSNVGAENPFPLKRSENTMPTTSGTLEESNTKMSEQRKRLSVLR